LNDMHRGRDCGKAWSLLIDLSAIMLIVVSLSGLGLIWFQHKQRAAGLLMMMTGAVVMVFIYLRLVP
jgi:uncharacterized protein